jgi:hypothetical protein
VAILKLSAARITIPATRAMSRLFLLRFIVSSLQYETLDGEAPGYGFRVER